MKHLSLGQRYEIFALRKHGLNISQIAREIGVHKSTVSRELRRNSYFGTKNYYPKFANDRALARARVRNCMARRRVPKDVFRTACRLMKERHMSPEQVVGYCRRSGIEMCSVQSLYTFIWKDRVNGGRLYMRLRRSGRKYRRRGSPNNGRRFIPDAVDISERPSVVDRRSRFGDFEIDTIVGCNPSQHILTVVERRTRLLLMRRLPIPTAAMTKVALLDLLRPLYEKHFVRTITADNGMQFAMHKAISAATGAQVYFARPYHPWERGTNENTNGLIREFIPKGSDFDRLSERDIFEIQSGLNARPRKVLGFSTPIEQLYLLTGIDARVAFQP